MLRISLGPVQIYEFSGDEFEDTVSEFFIPVIVRSGPDFRGRMALQELDKDLSPSLTRWGPRSAARTEQMAANSSGQSRMLFAIQVAGQGHMVQRDRIADLATGSAVLLEARSAYKWASQTEN